MLPSSIRSLLAAAGVAWLISACGGATTPNGATTVTPAGTTIRVADDDGSVLELIFPPGAVAEPIAVLVERRETPPGARARYEVEPSGISLLAPLQLRYEPPTGQVLGTSSTFSVGDPIDASPLPSTVTAPRLLTATSQVLGPADPEATVTRLQAGGGFLNVADIECQIAIDSLLTRLESARNSSFSYPQSAQQLIAQYEATQQLCAADPGTFEAQIAIIQQKACEGYRDAEVNASVLTSDTSQAFKKNVGSLLNWEGVKEAAGADCAGGNFDQAIGAEFDEFVEAYEQKLDSGTLPTKYDELWNELREATDVAAHAATLGNTDAEQKVEQRVLAKIYDLLRDAAYDHCRDDDEQIYLADLLWSGQVKRKPLPTALAQEVRRLAVGNLPDWANFSAADLAKDIQLCASKVTVEVFTPLPEKRDDLTEELEGSDTPGGHTTKASTRAPATGSIVLDGDIAAFQCSANVSDDKLVVKLKGVEIERKDRSGSALLGSRLDIDLEEALDKAGIDAEKKGTYDLEIIREGAMCGGSEPYGESPFTLFTVSLEIDPAPKLTSVSASPTSIQADVVGSAVSFSLVFEDQGENLEKVKVVFTFGTKKTPSEVDLKSSPDVSGFTVAKGTGTVATGITIYCSEKGTNPLTVGFTLIDDFDQESEEETTDITVTYTECP
jgi:hypothetical protein